MITHLLLTSSVNKGYFQGLALDAGRNRKTQKTVFVKLAQTVGATGAQNLMDFGSLGTNAPQQQLRCKPTEHTSVKVDVY